MRKRTFITGVAALVAAYWIAAYWIIPALWARYELRLDPDRVMLTATPQGIPGDPVNVGLVGSEEEVLRAFNEAAWNPADPVTLASGIKIGLSVVLDRPYKDAPISPLIYDGRKQDLAFEKQEGASADRRHHVRLWRIAEATADGRTLWLGSASFDRGVGVSHDTGQITHHISPDVDAERDYLIGNLDKAGAIEDSFTIPGRGPTWEGRNGGGDLYFTDGMALIGILKPTG
ncbi:MAG TPA: LssY C-terminal domain-containing protein [Rhizobiaceae bacterium]|nr:LssY C-terminal domain-containing protein [Rhizobiaceae bacterium]